MAAHDEAPLDGDLQDEAERDGFREPRKSEKDWRRWDERPPERESQVKGD